MDVLRSLFDSVGMPEALRNRVLVEIGRRAEEAGVPPEEWAVAYLVGHLLLPTREQMERMLSDDNGDEAP